MIETVNIFDGCFCHSTRAIPEGYMCYHESVEDYERLVRAKMSAWPIPNFLIREWAGGDNFSTNVSVEVWYCLLKQKFHMEDL